LIPDDNTGDYSKGTKDAQTVTDSLTQSNSVDMKIGDIDKVGDIAELGLKTMAVSRELSVVSIIALGFKHMLRPTP
jgi:hypothetical protein